jgi:NADH-quinone oxidoreductase subunit L
VMTMPLQVLAVLSAIGGLMGIPHRSWLEHGLEPVIPVHEGLGVGVTPELEWILMAVSVAGAIFGILFALRFYRNLGLAESVAKRFKVLHRLLVNKWYVDEIYEAILIRPIQKLSVLVWKGIDVGVIDRLVLGFGRVSDWTGETVRVIQTGSIQIYALMILIGLVATAGYLFYGWT